MTTPNLPLPTLGGCQLWSDLRWREGWRLQRNVWTGHHRLLDPRDLRRAWGRLATCEKTLERLVPRVRRGQHLVVLLHGLGRSPRSLAALERSLVHQGHTVANLTYASTRGSIGTHADVLAELVAHLVGVEGLSFVTHSLGGLVVLEMLRREGGVFGEHLAPGRLVMIAPPSRGSVVARRLARLAPLRWIVGPALVELGRDRSVPPPPPPPSLPAGLVFGVIAAGRGTRRGYNPWIKGDDDGLVGLSETHLEGAADTLVVRGLHPFVMNDPRVLEGVGRFLRTGRFGPPGGPGPGGSGALSPGKRRSPPDPGPGA